MELLEKLKIKAVSIILVVILIGIAIFEISIENTMAVVHILQNPTKNVSDNTIWDCVYFGNYPQAEIIPSGEYISIPDSLLEKDDVIISDDLYSKLKNAVGWDKKGDILLNGKKYRRIKKTDASWASDETGEFGVYSYIWQDTNTYHYFAYEPIKWRVLNVNGNNAFLLADKGLDDQYYNGEKAEDFYQVGEIRNCTWETSLIRSWLNGYAGSYNSFEKNFQENNFINSAFTSAEKLAIINELVENSDSIQYGTNGGNDTKDKVFFLSESQVYTKSATSYGFKEEGKIMDEAREVRSSTYAKAMGMQSDVFGKCLWWLRSPGITTTTGSYVYEDGIVNKDDLYYTSLAVRPALHLDLSSNCWSYAGTVSADGKINEQESLDKEVTISSVNTTDSSYYTNTNSILGYSYGNYNSLLSILGEKFISFKNTLATNNGKRIEGIIIPGLVQTNQGNNTKCKTMVPQGVCVAGNYLLISACDEAEKVEPIHKSYAHTKVHNSVIYVINKETREYLTTIILNDNTCHVGALAWNQQSGNNGEIYIADSSESNNYKVWRFPLSKIKEAVNKGENVVKAIFVNNSGVDYFPVSNKPSFLTYFNGKVYVGTLNMSTKVSYMYGYKVDRGEITKKETKISLPNKTQGVDIITAVNGKTYLFASSSLGRNNSSTLNAYVVNNGTNLSINANTPSITKTFPNMSEDISIQGDYLYTAYESAANVYRLGLDTNMSSNKSGNAIDRITISSINKLLGMSSISKRVKSSIFNEASVISENSNDNEIIEDDMDTLGMSDEIIEQGKCGNDLCYDLYSDYTLVISGFGNMDDYDSQKAPWEKYQDKIRKIVVDTNVTSIGAYAFKNCTALTKVVISDFVDEEIKFVIGDNAFEGCSKLSVIDMSDTDYSIAQDAFKDCEMTLCSSSESVIEYSRMQEIKNHTHTYEFSTTITATCGTHGYDIYECSCGKQYTDNYTEPTGQHNYELLSSEKSIDGKQEIDFFRCKQCGSEYEEERKKEEVKTVTQVEKVTNDTKEKVIVSKAKIKSVKNIKKRLILVKYNKVKEAKKYQIQYALNKKFTKKKKTKITRKLAYTIKNLKKGKTYYVRVRGYYTLKRKKVYGKWSNIKKVKINR